MLQMPLLTSSLSQARFFQVVAQVANADHFIVPQRPMGKGGSESDPYAGECRTSTDRSLLPIGSRALSCKMIRQSFYAACCMSNFPMRRVYQMCSRKPLPDLKRRGQSCSECCEWMGRLQVGVIHREVHARRPRVTMH